MSIPGHPVHKNENRKPDQTRFPTYVGAYTYGYNNHSLGIGFQGDFQQQTMPDAQLKAGAALCKKLLQDHSLTETDIKRHKDLSATACPGKNFIFTELKELLSTVQDPDLAKNEIYRVQVGAFKNREYAENLKQQLVNQGYADDFIDVNLAKICYKQ